MLREFLSIFRSDDPLAAMGEQFARMLHLTYDMTVQAGEHFFQGTTSDENRTRMYQDDIEVNKLERAIRKQVIARLAIHREGQDMPYCLYLLNLVKDVERLGDYAKNLTEVPGYRPGPLPSDPQATALEEIRRAVEHLFGEVAEVVRSIEKHRALEMIQQGRDITKRCDQLIGAIAAADYDARTAVALVLGARYYKRIAAHLVNVLSSVVMPLHKIDFFDESEINKDPDT